MARTRRCSTRLSRKAALAVGPLRVRMCWGKGHRKLPSLQPAYCDHGAEKCNSTGGTAPCVLRRASKSIGPKEVFEYVSDVGNYPEWMAHVLEVRKQTPGPPQQSDSFVVAIKSVGRRFETPYERTSYEADRRYTDRAAGGPIPNQRWHSAFQEVPGGTRFASCGRRVEWLAQAVGAAPKAGSRAPVEERPADAEGRRRGAVETGGPRLPAPAHRERAGCHPKRV